jgi:hypothetical protein
MTIFFSSTLQPDRQDESCPERKYSDCKKHADDGCQSDVRDRTVDRLVYRREMTEEAVVSPSRAKSECSN